MVPTPVRPTRRQLGGGAVAVCSVLGYEFSLFWVNYGPVSNHEFWLLGLLAVPVALMLTATRGRWDSRTVVALLVLGTVTSVVGLVGSSAVAPAGPILGPETYHAFRYDWASNTLRYGQTNPGGTPPSLVHPHRLSMLFGVVALTLGAYGWLPWRRTRDRRSASGECAADT
ncbi:hypothetical protein [Halomarina rubra]|uniref:Uncharacterized protein n=1 Tax=Halomarina rubra TaxID=2071873 RepID=A0ABD6AVT2_9EURY|nr:hypothetical protein [Halomarina rubra]